MKFHQGTLLVIASLAALGCNAFRDASENSNSAAGSASAVTSAATVPVLDSAAAANAKLPKALQGKLRFELKKVQSRNKEVTSYGAVPSGWPSKKDKGFPNWFEPPKEPDLGFVTNFQVGYNCDGLCVEKDWPALITERFNALSKDKQYEVVVDKKLPENGRLMTLRGKDGKRARVEAAWHRTGASRYLTCSAFLDHESLVPALEAFAIACETTSIELE